MIGTGRFNHAGVKCLAFSGTLQETEASCRDLLSGKGSVCVQRETLDGALFAFSIK